MQVKNKVMDEDNFVTFKSFSNFILQQTMAIRLGSKKWCRLESPQILKFECFISIYAVLIINTFFKFQALKFLPNTNLQNIKNNSTLWKTYVKLGHIIVQLLTPRANTVLMENKFPGGVISCLGNIYWAQRSSVPCLYLCG